MKRRVLIEVSPLFNKKLKEIQANNLLKDIRKSIRQITEDIIENGYLDGIENDREGIKIRMDKRRRII